MNLRKINWPVWLGLLMTLVASFSYPLVFVWFPVTRDFPWASLVLFGVAAILLFVGARRAFRPEQRRRSKVAASVVATLCLAFFALFVLGTIVMPRWVPKSEGAPRVGQKAPDFTLADTSGTSRSLTELLTSSTGRPSKGVLLIFYRGDW